MSLCSAMTCIMTHRVVYKTATVKKKYITEEHVPSYSRCNCTCTIDAAEIQNLHLSAPQLK